jgi:hypothetical protein
MSPQRATLQRRSTTALACHARAATRRSSPRTAYSDSACRATAHTRHWSRCPFAAEATPEHESLLASPQGSCELSTPKSNLTPRMASEQTPTMWFRGVENHRDCGRASSKCASSCCTEAQHSSTARITGIEATFPRFVAFQRNQMRRSLCDGLPHRHPPLSGFLTLSAV